MILQDCNGYKNLSVAHGDSEATVFQCFDYDLISLSLSSIWNLLEVKKGMAPATCSQAVASPVTQSNSAVDPRTQPSWRNKMLQYFREIFANSMFIFRLTHDT